MSVDDRADAPIRRMRVAHASGRGVAARWRSQYRNADGKWNMNFGGNAEAVYEALIALGSAPEPDAVAVIIGNKSWAHLRCSCCDAYVTSAYELRGEYSEQIYLCAACIVEAHSLMQRQPLPAEDDAR